MHEGPLKSRIVPVLCATCEPCRKASLESVGNQIVMEGMRTAMSNPVAMKVAADGLWETSTKD